MSNSTHLEALGLPAALCSRILCRVPPAEPRSKNDGNEEDETFSTPPKKPFILYLPTVLLRKRHNPAFALACRLANHHQVPVLVLCTVLDDTHFSKQPLSPIVMTARRLAFTLEALQSCCKEFEEHGAGVAIRVHGPGARTPHHLSLSHKALAVVSDEPFVDPHRSYLRRIVKTCQAAKVPSYTVDGSTTVPPLSKLKLSKSQTVEGDISFTGAPAKAWRWEKQTNPDRKSQVSAVVRDGAFDAPELEHKLNANFFLQHEASDAASTKDVLDALPPKWKDASVSCPDQRPWTVEELLSISDCKEWSMSSWDGADTSVSPCRQTHGSEESAKQRWQSFLDSGLKNYAKRRNQIVQPHAVSRISCYLNLGILSIFDVIHDVWQVKSSRSGYSTGCQKFLDEVIKWREGSYVHAFANPEYHSVDVLPQWSRQYLTRLRETTVSPSAGYFYKQLESASTGDGVWDAMQRYLIDAGELHNNARMTWGKTVVHWQARRMDPSEVLWQLICLNDRFALDGLSPPSYGGLLWCFGWGDKPASGNKVSEKWASRYRTGANGFEQAKNILLNAENSVIGSGHLLPNQPSPSKKARVAKNVSSPSQSTSILSFFSPVKEDDDGACKVVG